MMTRGRTLAGVCVLTLAAATLAAAGLLNLPGTVQATHGPWNAGTQGTTIDITLSGIVGTYDITNMTYPGWCAEDNHGPDYGPGEFLTPYDSTDPATMPTPFLQALAWSQVNYLLNHKAGTAQEIQAALWILMGTNDPSNPTFPSTPAVLAMVADAQANGGSFVPGPGQVAAVLLYGDGIMPAGYWQETLIEVTIPPSDFAGCTPGYWRNHMDDWPAAGISPGADFDTTFGVNYFNPDITLAQAITLGGGGVRKIARHGTAGLLSAGHPDVNYPFTQAQVIAFVQAGDVDALAAANELGCTIP